MLIYIIIPSFFYRTKIINRMRFYIWYYLSKNFANFYLSNFTWSKKFFLQSVTCNSVFCVGVVHQISDLKLIQVHNIKFFILDYQQNMFKIILKIAAETSYKKMWILQAKPYESFHTKSLFLSNLQEDTWQMSKTFQIYNPGTKITRLRK